MKILMLSWRDLKHPEKGGAEDVTDIYLSKLAKAGHNVTLFTSESPKSNNKEKHNGYNIIRKGKGLRVFYEGLKYAKKHEKEYDLIIDQVNTIPFFTPLVIPKEKRVAFFHQLCKNIWFYEKRMPISLLGYFLESMYLKLYGNTRAFTISKSSKDDLNKYVGLDKKKILVLENQIDFKPINKIQKKENYFIYVGRITPSKRIGDIIKALKYVEKSKLTIVGDGKDNYKNKLIKLIQKSGLNSRVKFVGSVSEKERNKLMSNALAIIVTSVREGWGLIVTEANANGTLAITYNVAGLVDANKEGLICEKNSPKELAKLMTLIKKDERILNSKSIKSLQFARSHSNWDKNAKELERWL